MFFFFFRLGLELPVHDWFWPIFSCKREINNDDDDDDNDDYYINNEMINKKNLLQTKCFKMTKNKNEYETYFIYSNGKIAPEPPLFYDLNEIELQNW